MSRPASILSLLVIGVAASRAATITNGSASSSVLSGLSLASQNFSLSGPGFTVTGSGTSDNAGPCTLSCSPGDTLGFSSIGNGPDGGIAGTLTLNGVSQNYSFAGEIPKGALDISFFFDLVVPPIPSSCLMSCTVVLTGPFTADLRMAFFNSPLPVDALDAFGGGTATVDLVPLFPNHYFFVGQSFSFVPVPEPPPFPAMTIALAAMFVAGKNHLQKWCFTRA